MIFQMAQEDHNLKVDLVRIFALFIELELSPMTTRPD